MKRKRTGASITREDSDDELGSEDLSWEWIYESKDPRKNDHIVGAKFGKFECMLGDCVLLKAEGHKRAWVAIVCEFFPSEAPDDEKKANFMWFSSEKEIRNRDRKRSDAFKNELYITPAFDINPLASINGTAQVLSHEKFLSKYPSGNIGPRSRDFGKVFICRRGCNVRTATYTNEFCWEKMFQGPDDIVSLARKIKNETKGSRIRKGSSQKAVEDSDSKTKQSPTRAKFQPQTPRKKRKIDITTTPNSKSLPHQASFIKAETPTHKRTVIRKPLEYTPLGTRFIPASQTTSPFQIARMQLHVSSVPVSLPCREQAFSQVYSNLEAAILEGSGSCIYISGTPGTGKTATVREVITQLHAAVQAEDLDDFIFVEINGMKVTDPHQAYSMLWEALEGDRVNPRHALNLLDQEFNSPSPRRVPCVVLMDELDQLVTKDQSVMYNFFNWPSLAHSRLIVLAVANTMDLPERTLSNKISSRLGLTRITFPGYTHEQLIQIIKSRLECVPGELVDQDAIEFASRKVAAVSGDARRALDICRRAVEIAENFSTSNSQLPLTLSKNVRRDSNTNHEKQQAQVVISTIKQAIGEATSTPLQECLKSLAIAPKMLLTAVVTRMRRTGLEDGSLAETIDESKKLALAIDKNAAREVFTCHQSAHALGVRINLALSSTLAPRMPAFSLATAELAEAGILIVEARKGERNARVRLNISENEVKIALKSDPYLRGIGL